MTVVRGIIKSKHWFVPLHELNKTDGTNLRLASSELVDSDRTINGGSAFTVSLESFFVKDNFDEGKSGNDLLVRSRVKYGSEPPIESIHFFAKDILPGTVIDNLPSEHVFATQDHDDKNRVFIEIEIIEIDKGLEINNDASDSIRSIAETLGAFFPAVLPFSGVAVELVRQLEKLKAASTANTIALRSALDLYKPETGEAPLRCGAYVFFNTEVEGVMYKLRDLKLEPTSTTIQKPIHDYVVIKIVPELINSGGKEEELLVNQQLAGILAQPDEEERDDVEKLRERFKFLQEIARSAKQLRELNYFYQLKRKKDRGEILTESQQTRLNQIAEDLREYIS